MTHNHRFITIYADGGVFGRNPSPRGVYWSIEVEVPGAEPVSVRKQSPAWRSNNDAEWLALREALRYAHQHHRGEPLQVIMDSRHVVDCFNGIKHLHIERLLRLHLECTRLAAELPFVAVQWKPRAVLVDKVGH